MAFIAHAAIEDDGMALVSLYGTPNVSKCVPFLFKSYDRVVDKNCDNDNNCNYDNDDNNCDCYDSGDTYFVGFG